MPQLSDLIGKRKFVKKEYRPWDLSGTGTVDCKSQVAPFTEENPHTQIDPINVEMVATGSMVLNSKPEIIEQPIARCELLHVKTDNDLDNDSGNNQVTTREQTGNNQVTLPKQTGNNQVTTREQTGNNTGNKTGNDTGNANDLSSLIDSIKKLTGIQKNLFLYIFNVCSGRTGLNTGNVLSTDLASAANCSIGSVKTSLSRLIEKQLVLRLQGKASRGGHMVLAITKEIQSAAIQAQQSLFVPFKFNITDNNTGNITGNDTGNTAPYSSSIYKNTTTTSLPEDWKKINFEPLSDIGFSEIQLHQLLVSNTTEPTIVQDSINRFAYSLKHNEKAKAYTQPLNVLMGILRKGQRWNEPNYVPAKELTLRQLVEDKQKENERWEEMIKQLVELEFPDWRKKLAEEEIMQIVPEDIRKTNIPAAILSVLRRYFIDHVLTPRLNAM